MATFPSTPGPRGKLEPEYGEAFSAWKDAPGPTTLAPLLTAADPLLKRIARSYLGDDGPLAHGSARQAFVKALPTYDPSKAQLSTFAYSQLRGLQRQAQRSDRGIRVPDRVASDRWKLEQERVSLAHELGREPTDDEIIDSAGISPRRFQLAQQYQPAVTQSTLDTAAGGTGMGGFTASQLNKDSSPYYMDLVYDSLGARDQAIIDLAFGRRGRQPLSNQAIAAKLKISPGAVSQRKAKIQAMLDEMMASELL